MFKFSDSSQMVLTIGQVFQTPGAVVPGLICTTLTSLLISHVHIPFLRQLLVTIVKSFVLNEYFSSVSSSNPLFV